MNKAISKIQKARKLMKYADDHEIAKMTGLSLEKVQSASHCLRVVSSMNQSHDIDYFVRLILFPSMPLSLLFFFLCCVVILRLTICIEA